MNNPRHERPYQFATRTMLGQWRKAQKNELVHLTGVYFIREGDTESRVKLTKSDAGMYKALKQLYLTDWRHTHAHTQKNWDGRPILRPPAQKER